MTSPAIAVQGTKIAYSDGGSPSSFTDIAGVVGISDIGGGSAPVNDISDLDSTFKEKMMGLPDEGQITLTLNPNPSNATHVALRAARAARTRLEFRITYPNAKIDQFFGYVLMFRRDVRVGDALRGSITIEIDGPVAST